MASSHLLFDHFPRHPLADASSPSGNVTHLPSRGRVPADAGRPSQVLVSAPAMGMITNVHRHPSDAWVFFVRRLSFHEPFSRLQEWLLLPPTRGHHADRRPASWVKNLHVPRWKLDGRAPDIVGDDGGIAATRAHELGSGSRTSLDPKHKRPLGYLGER